MAPVLSSLVDYNEASFRSWPCPIYVPELELDFVYSSICTESEPRSLCPGFTKLSRTQIHPTQLNFRPFLPPIILSFRSFDHEL